mmetsp:Transcript_28660/g.25368  ORF Transcript_28660/g.25368 Transcript_28660/m.25368 type:complete len:124 (+) Transcript_28660:881-1252(+)
MIPKVTVIYTGFLFLQKDYPSSKMIKWMSLMECKKTQKVQEDHMNSIRQTFADKSSLRLTSVKDKTSQSINYGEVKSILVSPFRAGGEARVDSRFVDLNIRNKNSTMSRIKNSSSFSKLPVYD